MNAEKEICPAKMGTSHFAGRRIRELQDYLLCTLPLLKTFHSGPEMQTEE